MLKRNFICTVGAAALLSGVSMPASADPVTIRVVAKDLLNTNPDDVKLMQIYENALRAKGTDIKIEIVNLPASGYADKLGAMLLSGDIPDLIYFQGGDQAMSEQGILEDWNTWLPKTTYLKDALYPHNKARLQNYPYLLYVFPPRVSQPVMRADWLSKTGLSKPHTVEDYTNLFKAIKKGNFGGVGSDHTYGMTVPGNMNEADSIFNQAFGISASWLKDGDGNWISSLISEQQRTKIAYYSSLREQGLLDPEYITTKWDTREDKFYSGRVGVVFSSSAENVDVYSGKMRQVNPDANPSLALLSPPKGAGGQGLAAVDVSKEPRGFAISSLSEHKEEVVKFLDFVASPEGQALERLGFEGEQYTKDGDTLKPTAKMATWYVRFIASSTWKMPDGFRSEAATQFLDNVSRDYKPDNDFIWPAEYAADIDSSQNIYKAWMYKFISGQAKLDQWDQFVSEWKVAGGDRLTEYARTVLK
ncbi:extracellular solute-binding protein [Ochrobactrum sp. RH2CCR150]|uniref:extracellular solute-binding protein n=1 Tax=Ochrobactrum sp. RH2CCR150 TaxID=2587044 RepID=UPI0017BA1105|nr:putative aldouronate transport system substrate-binding protein [Ochrobactrum sp. RH2CCR150]